MYVIKRNGNKERVKLEKIHKVLEWAGEGLNVSVSQVEINSKLALFEDITTQQIHETLIKSAADLIDVETPDYQFMAARLTMFNLRKKAYNYFTPPSLTSHIHKMCKQGVYISELLTYNSDEYADGTVSFIELNKYIRHERDFNFSYAAVKQLEGKYLVQDRSTGRIYETPQFLYMCIAICLFHKQGLTKIIEFYDAISQHKISLPTPIMGGLRTPVKQFSSCVVIECDDTLDSINETSSSIVKYISSKAGIGINAGRIRAVGSPIRNGDASHTGCIPFYKLFQASVKSCSQGGIRGGAGTVFYPIWHAEVESLLVLKNNKGVEENRVRHLDYGVQINKLMYTRLINNGDITLFSPHNTPGLYDAFFSDQELFEELYVKYENDPSITGKKIVKAKDLFSSLMQERASTGRVYIMNVDHCNTHSSFLTEIAPVRQSNLCMEITLPTKPIYRDSGEIGLCTLSAINLGCITNLKELESVSDLLVEALNNLLDYQDYLLPATKNYAPKRRSLGIGVINYAYYLAKNKVRYSDGSANNLTHELFEALQYYLLKASNRLAKEQGACELFNETKYSQGILPIDTYKKEVDTVHTACLHYDWEALRASIKKYGLRNSTLSSLMPSETSSQISNATNGIEPPRGYVTIKASKDGILKQIVPDYLTRKDDYELLWDLPNNKGTIELVSIMQKFVDQSISTNLSYDPEKFESGKVSLNTLIKDLLTSYKLGVKTLYYHNTRDSASDTPLASYLKPTGDSDCGDSCKI